MSDRYEIKGRLGRGGIGAVYEAFDTHLQRDVAIKRLLPREETKLNESSEVSLESEARALAALSHPNIVTIYEFAGDEQGPYVVFELVDGDTLNEIIGIGALSEADFYEVADQILDALVSAHKLNLLHRDIKPANVMLSWLPSGKFQIKMLDFGLAKFSQKPSLQTLDQKGSFLGSIDYVAPEQIELRPLDQRTDLYSLGCLLYFALTQSPPFTGESMAETMRNHLSGKVPQLESLRPDLSVAVCRWVMKLISTKPDDRPSSAIEALKELKEAKETKNETITDSVPTAKLVVPVVSSAQPVMAPKVLRNTQAIVSTPSPGRSSVPAHANTTTSRRKTAPKKPEKDPNRNSVYILIGSVVALFFVIGIAVSNYNRDKSPDSEEELRQAAVNPAPLPSPSLVSAIPDSNDPDPAPSRFENSDRYFDKSNFVRPGSLIAYYSVAGFLQTTDHTDYIHGLTTDARLGAVENLALKADPGHLLVTPDFGDQSPKIVEDTVGNAPMILCYDGQFLESNFPIENPMFSFMLFYRPAFFLLPTTLLEVDLAGGHSLQLKIEEGLIIVNSTLLEDELILKEETSGPGKITMTAVDINGNSKAIRVWSHRQFQKTLLTGKKDVSTPDLIQIERYRVGSWIDSPEPKGMTRLGGLAIYGSYVPDPVKLEIFEHFFESVYPSLLNP